MAITIRIESPLAPDAVMHAILDDGREWRESVIPAELRGEGVLKVNVSSRSAHFRMRDERGIGGPRYDTLQLRGVVSAQPGRGSVVVARCGRDAGTVTVIASLLIISFAIWISGGSGVGITLAFAPLIGGWRFAVDARVSRSSDPEARYLAERLERAIAAASAPA